MGFEFGLRHEILKRDRTRAKEADLGFRLCCPLVDRRQHQRALATANQFEIDLRGQLGVQQCAMFGARRKIDAKSPA